MRRRRYQLALALLLTTGLSTRPLEAQSDTVTPARPLLTWQDGLLAGFFGAVEMPGALAVAAAAAVLIAAAVIASLMPAARASRVDVLEALRSE